jgi:dihydroorotate dehydrogenase
MYSLIRPFLFLLPPETAHQATLLGLRLGFAPLLAKKSPADPALKTILWDRVFPNPVGLAAGFDKNAEVIAPLFQLGFGFVEIGTVTPKPQLGNPKPRIFREPKFQAVINRMGFPGLGIAKFKDNLAAFLAKKPRPAGVIGVNIGMNKDQSDPAKDYTALIRSIGPMADYLTINISSPNTPGLRNLQERGPLSELILAVMEERKSSCGAYPPPILVKLAPDLSDDQLSEIASVLLALKVDGVILTNTTLARPDDLPEKFAAERGGLSGAPLTDISTGLIRRFYELTKGQIPIIGVGGIMSGLDAYAKIRAGASLVQVYSGLVFHGPALITRINTEISELLHADGFTQISDAVGADHRGYGGEAGQEGGSENVRQRI